MRRCKICIALLSVLTLLSTGCGVQSTVTNTVSGRVRQVSAPSLQEHQTIDIVGASTPYPVIELLATAYESEVRGTRINLLDSSQSSGGITGVKTGLVEIGTVTRPPTLAEADDNLAYREVAKDALVVVTHPTVEGINNLTTEALRAIYSGQTTNWKSFGGPDASITVLDRAEDTSAKRLLREYYLGPNLSNAPDAIMLRHESDMIEAIQNTPYSIGILSLKVVADGLPVNHISLDGIAPTSQNLALGQYGMHRILGIVWYGNPPETTQTFIDFIFSQTGAEIIRQAGYVPSFTD